MIKSTMLVSYLKISQLLKLLEVQELLSIVFLAHNLFLSEDIVRINNHT